MPPAEKSIQLILKEFVTQNWILLSFRAEEKNCFWVDWCKLLVSSVYTKILFKLQYYYDLHNSTKHTYRIRAEVCWATV